MALRGIALACCVGALVLAGCSGAPDAPTATAPDDAFAGLASSALDDARANGASEGQLATIEQALAAGEVSFEQVQASVNATFECFEASGIRYEALAPRVENGILYPNYAFEGTDTTAVADECIHANSDYVEALYAMQPAAVEASDHAFEAAMPVLIDCLRGLGYEVEDDISADDLKDVFTMKAEDVGTPRELEALERFTCVNGSGITGW